MQFQVDEHFCELVLKFLAQMKKQIKEKHQNCFILTFLKVKHFNCLDRFTMGLRHDSKIGL